MDPPNSTLKFWNFVKNAFYANFRFRPTTAINLITNLHTIVRFAAFLSTVDSFHFWFIVVPWLLENLFLLMFSEVKRLSPVRVVGSFLSKVRSNRPLKSREPSSQANAHCEGYLGQGSLPRHGKSTFKQDMWYQTRRSGLTAICYPLYGFRGFWRIRFVVRYLVNTGWITNNSCPTPKIST